MTLDLILRDANVLRPDGTVMAADIGVSGGRIAAVETGLAGDAETVDCAGGLVSGGLVETHIHLDKSQIIDQCRPAVGRARDHMQRVAEVKPGFTEEDVYERAKTSLEWCLSHGTMHMRTHVEVDPNVGLRSFEALRQLAKDYAWAIDLELCAFAQEGMSNVPEADRNVEECLKRGAKVVGGAPGYDPDHAAQINRIFELARAYDVDVDIHLDVGPDPENLDIHLVCDLAEKYGWGGRTAVGHGAKYAMLPLQDLATVAKRMADAGVALTVLPATDLFVMGRDHEHSVPRGVADCNSFHEHGVTCSLASNNILNPFTPLGDGSMTRMANLHANTVQRGGHGELAEMFAMISARAAKILRRDDYGIAVGNPADLVVWNKDTPTRAVASVDHPYMGFKRGRRVFTRPKPELHRPEKTN